MKIFHIITSNIINVLFAQTLECKTYVFSYNLLSRVVNDFIIELICFNLREFDCKL